mmetsp:Transcript_9803/g.18406  ORF Transcript_9803/g.18406 Transcript_9803/m.18406 type:complete len:239 (-) Transcript_9803:170-886(-)
MAGSFTNPPREICSLRASNCGLIRTMRSPPRLRILQIAGITLSTEMKDRSSVTRDTGSGSPFRCRTLVRSSTTTLWSTLTFSATCPYPTSTPYTFAAPRCNRQSVKPPVERPASIATTPCTSTLNSSSAASIFSPALHTYLGTSARISMLAVGRTWAPLLNTGSPSTLTLPCAIQDWMTLRLYSGLLSTQSSSRRCFFFTLLFSAGMGTSSLSGAISLGALPALIIKPRSSGHIKVRV